MLEKIPAPIGAAMKAMRAGAAGLAMNDAALGGLPRSIVVSSEAFAHDGPLPRRATADGEGESPPLTWRDLPNGTRQLVLIVEDADSPTPAPLVHALALELPIERGHLDARALNAEANDGREHPPMGKSSSLRPTYLPPDPPTGHGTHRYYFQLFALDQRLPLSASPGRSELVRAMRGHALAVGVLVGTYERSG
jgi:Raf kinase inhibitor-like YbhB/YbcL family protein